MKDNYDISKLNKKKKKVNSRAKGSTFERQIAKILNERFNTSEFSRTPGSGAFATTHSLPDHLKIYGDLITPQNFKFCIECKKGYNDESIYSLYNYSSNFWGFIDQCQKDADKCGKFPMLIFKQDRQKTLAVIPSNISILNTNKYIEIHKDNIYYKIYLFDDLLKEEDIIWLD
jgi:Holliday junction resolvase